MEIETLYLFKEEFFTEENAVRDFVSGLYRDIKKQNEDNMTVYLLSRSTLIENLCVKTVDSTSLSLLRVTQANFLLYTSYGMSDKTICETALSKISLVDESDRGTWDKGLTYGYYFVYGTLCLQMYELISQGEDHNYKLKDLQMLMKSKYFYTTLFEYYLKHEIDLRANNTRKLIGNYSQVLGGLSRYVEPFYYLEQVEKKHRGFNGEIKLAKVVLYDSIMKKTCDHYSPVLLLRMDRDIRSIKKGNCLGRFARSPKKSELA